MHPRRSVQHDEDARTRRGPDELDDGLAVDGAGPRDEGALVRRGVQPHRAVVGAGQHVALPEGTEGQRAHGRREDVQVRLESSRIGSVVGGLNDEEGRELMHKEYDHPNSFPIKIY